jgi:signal transduction histidine kinase
MLGGMPIHSVSGPEPEPIQPPAGIPNAEVNATMEAWTQALKADARAEKLLKDLKQVHLELNERSQQSALMRHVANILTATSRADQLGSLILDVLQSEFGAHQGIMWSLLEDHYGACCGMAFDRRQLDRMHLPAPHPFPHYPILIYQSQWLEMESLPPALKLIQAKPEDGLYFIPFEHQTLLVGFTVLSIPKIRVFSIAEQESLEVLQRLFAASLHSAWTLQDLQYQRESLRKEAEDLKLRAEALDRQNHALRRGHELRADFMAYATDELRTQLLGILAQLNHLRQDQGLSQAEQEDILLEGLISGQYTAELLNLLSELTKPNRIDASIPVRPTNTSLLLAHVESLVHSLSRRVRGAIQWPPLVNLPDVMADSETLTRVLVSLCAGALQSSPDGELRLFLERDPVLLSLILEIRDVNLGQAIRALDSRLSVDSGEKYLRGHGGLGLGLVISRQLILAMGGRFTASHNPEKQETVIRLDLPLA